VAERIDTLPGDRPDPDDETHHALFEAWRAGDKDAGDRLVQDYFEPIRDYFIRRTPDEHEELVQKTFLGLIEAKEKWRGEGTVRVYIYCIARNVFRRYLRDVRRKPNFDPLSNSLVDAYGRRPSSMLAEREEHQILSNALQEIPCEQQDLLELHYFGGLTGPELRDMFQIPEGTVRGRLRRARKELRTKYEEISERPRPTDEQVDRWLLELRR
jgi:RNA polymerase sigma factor (sigma-70 family)